MPTGQGLNIYQADTGTLTQALTNAFHAPVALDLSNERSPDDKPLTYSSFPAKVSTIYIHVHTIAGGCTSLILRLSPDATGDEIIVPDTTATLATGYTNPARGGVVFRYDGDIVLSGDTLYWTVKTNAGTANLKYVKITFERP